MQIFSLQIVDGNVLAKGVTWTLVVCVIRWRHGVGDDRRGRQNECSLSDGRRRECMPRRCNLKKVRTKVQAETHTHTNHILYLIHEHAHKKSVYLSSFLFLALLSLSLSLFLPLSRSPSLHLNNKLLLRPANKSRIHTSSNLLIYGVNMSLNSKLLTVATPLA